MSAPATQNQPNPSAPAGAADSLGQQSKRDGRPATGNNVVEAIDEESPQIPRPDPQSSDQ